MSLPNGCTPGSEVKALEVDTDVEWSRSLSLRTCAAFVIAFLTGVYAGYSYVKPGEPREGYELINSFLMSQDCTVQMRLKKWDTVSVWRVQQCGLQRDY